MNFAALAALRRVRETDTWFRCIDPAHIATALSSWHTTARLARFNPGYLLKPSAQFESLSFADDPDVALREIEAIFQSLAGGAPSRVSNPMSSWTLTLKIQVNLAEVFDLTDLTVVQTQLGTHAQELTGDWLGYDMRTHTTRVTGPNGVAPTQELGFELFQSGIEGFRSISAKVPTNKTLTIFPKNLAAGSSVTVTDSSGKVVHRLP
ncbi:RES domain-containing protein [Rhodoblastus sp.]|uniref:RES domain-containing protein n=1 Tax=Rhodoblastus sp. TaxID=1962975 RepID=UPI003F9A9643